MKKLSEFKYPCLAGEYFPMIVFSETSGVVLSEGTLLVLEEGEFVAPDINVGYQFNKEDLDIMRVVLDNTDYNFDIKINRLTPFRYVDLTGLNIRDYVSEPDKPVIARAYATDNNLWYKGESFYISSIDNENHLTVHGYKDTGERFNLSKHYWHLEMIETPAPVTPTPPVTPLKFCELSREQHLDLINHVLDGGSLEHQCDITGEWYPVDYLPDCEDGVYRKYDTTSEVEEIDAEIARLVLLKQELMK